MSLRKSNRVGNPLDEDVDGDGYSLTNMGRVEADMFDLSLDPTEISDNRDKGVTYQNDNDNPLIGLLKGSEGKFSIGPSTPDRSVGNVADGVLFIVPSGWYYSWEYQYSASLVYWFEGELK